MMCRCGSLRRWSIRLRMLREVGGFVFCRRFFKKKLGIARELPMR